MRRLATALLRLYPRRWRERYGPEMRALLADHRVRPATLADLVVAALRARADPTNRHEEAAMARSARRGRGDSRCSFCGKGKDQVGKLVAGPGVFICDGCVELCNEVLSREAGPRADPRRPRRPHPAAGRRPSRRGCGNCSSAPRSPPPDVSEQMA